MRIVDRDIEVLNELVACRASGIVWARPLDCGGCDGSDHSYRLSRLVRAGLAESRQRSAWRSRGSKEYRATLAGVGALATWKQAVSEAA